MKKLIPNPKYGDALFAQNWIVHPDAPKEFKMPEVRTNNPNYLRDGCRVEDRVPSHIEVDV